MIISVVVFLDFAIHFKKFATVVKRNSEIILAAIPKLTRFCWSWFSKDMSSHHVSYTRYNLPHFCYHFLNSAMSVVRFGLELAKALLCILFKFYFLFFWISCEIPDKNLHIVYLVLKIFLSMFFFYKKVQKEKKKIRFYEIMKNRRERLHGIKQNSVFRWICVWDNIIVLRNFKIFQGSRFKKNHQWNHLCGFYLTDNIYWSLLYMLRF